MHRLVGYSILGLDTIFIKQFDKEHFKYLIMKLLQYIKQLFFTGVLAAFVFSSCNKDVDQFPNPTQPAVSSKKAVADTLSAAGYTLYNAMVTKSGLGAVLNDKAKTFTLFVPNNAAVKQFITAVSGGLIPAGAPDANFLGFINSANFTAASAQGIVGYNSVPQALNYTNMSGNFPNFQYPTLLNPAPSVSALLRLTTFPSKANGNFVNNVPLTGVSVEAGNGRILETGAFVVPPSRYLWDRINADADLTYLKAAIKRADTDPTAPGALEGALKNIGASLTVFAPTDAAFKAVLTGAIAQALIAQGVPAATAMAQATALASTPDVFTNPAVATVLTVQTVKGMVVYHIMGSRAFANNFPTTQANFPTLLNGAISNHPGIGLKATFSGPMVVAGTVKGAVNAAASNLLINPTPEPGGSSDQHYLNGVIHKIDQVLLPQ